MRFICGCSVLVAFAGILVGPPEFTGSRNRLAGSESLLALAQATPDTPRLETNNPSFCLRALLLRLCSGSHCICLYDCMVCTTDENNECISQNSSYTNDCNQAYNQSANCCGAGMGGLGVCWTDTTISGTPTVYQRVNSTLATTGVALDSISVDEGVGVDPPRTFNVKFKLKNEMGAVGAEWVFARVFICDSPLPSGHECRIGVEISEQYATGAVDCGALDYRADKLRRVTFQDGTTQKTSVVILAEEA